MKPKLLLDTHALVRWIATPKRLSREQLRWLNRAEQLSETIAVSAITVVELADLVRLGRLELMRPLHDFFGDMEQHRILLLPITYDIGLEITALGYSLPDPADRAIVATARVHRMSLVTSDQRIIESGLVPVVE